MATAPKNTTSKPRKAAPKKAAPKSKITSPKPKATKVPPKPTTPKKAVGRKSTYNTDIANSICALLAEGLSLRTICSMDGMPTKTTVFNWLARHPGFVDQYARAKQQGSEALAEELLEIADDGTNDWMESLDKDGEVIGYKLNGEHVQRSRLRIDTRKWILAKLQPKKYGENLNLNHDVAADGPLATLMKQVAGSTLKPTETDPDTP